MITTCILLLFAGLLAGAAWAFGLAGHSWFGSDCLCIALGCGIGVVARAIEGNTER